MKRCTVIVVVCAAILLAGCNAGSNQFINSSPPKFYDGGYRAWFQGTADYKFDMTHWGEYSVFALYGIEQYVTPAADATATSVRVQNIRVLQQPKVGKVSFVTSYHGDAAPREVGKDFVVWSGGECLNNIRLQFRTDYLGVHQLGQNFSGTHGADWAFGVFSAGSGLKSEDLRFKVAYQIQVTDISGAKFIRDVELVMLSDDFLSLKNQFQSYAVTLQHKEPFKR